MVASIVVFDYAPGDIDRDIYSLPVFQPTEKIEADQAGQPAYEAKQ